MSNQKQFGVWMDTHTAVVLAKEETANTISVVAAVKGEKHSPEPNEKQSTTIRK